MKKAKMRRGEGGQERERGWMEGREKGRSNVLPFVRDGGVCGAGVFVCRD